MTSAELLAVANDRQQPMQRRVDATCALQHPRHPQRIREAAAIAERMLRAAARRMES